MRRKVGHIAELIVIIPRSAQLYGTSFDSIMEKKQESMMSEQANIFFLYVDFLYAGK